MASTLPKKRKILFCITKSNFGGAQRYVYDIVTNLPKNEYEIAVAFGGAAAPGDHPGVLADKLREAGIRTIYLKWMGRNVNIPLDIRSFFELRRVIQTEKPDILHLNSPKAGGIGAMAGRILRVPRIIYTAHGWAFLERTSIFSRIVRFMFSYTSALCSHRVICVCAHDKTAMRYAPFIQKKLVVIYNGIRSIPLLAPAIARKALVPSEVLNRHPHALWLGSIAELTGNKNLPFAIRAVGEYNKTARVPVFYTLIGDGELRMEIEREVHASAPGDVAILGFKQGAAMYLSGFDVFCLPSKKEGFPYAILEAGLAGLPVIASNVGGIPEIIADGVSGVLIDPAEPETLLNALDIVSNTELRTQLGIELKRRVQHIFTLDHMLEKTRALYES